jgi:transcription-repair coupling factor (superfamily II helicase)
MPDIDEKTTTKHPGALRRVLERLDEYEPVRRLVALARVGHRGRVPLTGLAGSSRSLVLGHLAQKSAGRLLLVVTTDGDQAADLAEELSCVLGESRVGHFPARQILPYDFRAPVGEIMGQRIKTLSDMLAGRLSAVVCPLRALLEPTIDRAELQRSHISLGVGDEVDLDDLVRRLVDLGFKRVPVVEEVGDFALRGGLVDFFTPGSSAPVRVELFGDEVDTIRHFDVATQRTVGQVDQVTVLPKREVPITHQTLEEYLDDLPEGDAEYIRSRYLNDPELPGLEWLAILFGLSQGALLDYIAPDAVIVTHGEGALRSDADDMLAEAAKLRDRLSLHFSRLPEAERYFRPIESTFASLSERLHLDILPFKGGHSESIDFGCVDHPAVGSRLDTLGGLLTDFSSSGMEYFIATDSPSQVERLRHLLSEREEITVTPSVEVADIKSGFLCAKAGVAILTDRQIFGRYQRRIRRKKYKEGVAIGDYASLNRKDYVVHTEHGIARYLGLETIDVDARKRDCLLLEYAEGDRLFVPIEEFNRVSKYAGKDTAPQLSHLGGPGWEKLKKRTRKAIETMAADLIRLYAERKAQPGYSFGEDTVWLSQLEASFPFEETKDQLKAINDVKYDMASDRAMDRLICGDVGYGKTEVAIRAAFKAIEHGKQVAVLVPTTILAQQHLQTFADRLVDFPVRIEMLSRFRSRKEQLEVVDDLVAGKVDLVIGTHRLFSKDIAFKDLGLLIVDEEHRFGVRHKEKLRKLRANVDTISMSATPIPRTLQMALTGVRDMSLIATSPKDRLPIATEIVEFDPGLIATAILREVDRGGQVFFVHNRVQTIDAMHRFLLKLLPQLRIGVGHGQMHEKELEGVMLGFLNRAYDVLLCTSIIESGLDIPNANTIIINRADRFGLAQLYQIRGRVGRSSRRAYAYLLTPPTRLMGGDAIKRLRALEAHSDLGTGFGLAMRDLEIRGAGTILGARQSGFIEEVGFDMYNKLLEDAIARLKGEPIVELPQTRLELDIETYLSDGYINDRHHKVDLYRRLADARTLDDVERIRDEMTDRFGRMPQSATNLIEATAVKIAASLLQIEKVRIKRGRAVLQFAEGHMLTRHVIETFRKATDCPLEFSVVGQATTFMDLGPVHVDQRLSYLRGVLCKV